MKGVIYFIYIYMLKFNVTVNLNSAKYTNGSDAEVRQRIYSVVL